MLSVFLIDDEPIILLGLKKLIEWEKYGFQITGTARNGLEALNKINLQKVDLVITDLKMPNIGGLELCEQLRKKSPGLKFIVLTAYDDFEYTQKSIRNGVSDYLLKPVKEKMLIESLERIRKQIEEEKYPYPFETENMLIDYVFKNNTEKTYEIIEELFTYIEQYKIPINDCKEIVIRLLRTLNFRLEQSGCGLRDILKENVLNDDAFSKVKTKKDIFDKIKNILSKVLEYRTKKQENELTIKTKQYIEENIEKDISLNTVAKHFYVNPSYLSLVFKKDVCINYSNYVTEQRMIKAKRLLSDDRLQIQQISEMVGYIDYR